MQAEEAIEVDGGVFTPAGGLRGPRHRDGGPHIVVALLAVRHHDVEAVGCAALEDGDQDFLARRGRIRGIERALAATAAPRRPPPLPAPSYEGKICG